jgi:hypothetical protein
MNIRGDMNVGWFAVDDALPLAFYWKRES